MATTHASTLERLVGAYVDDLRIRNYKAKTINGYEKNLHTFLAWAEGTQATTLSDFTAELVKTYIRYLQHKPKYAERGYTAEKWRTARIKPSAIRNYVRALKTFARWLAEEGYTPTNVLATVQVPKVDETPIEPFTDDELARIFAALDPSDAYDLRDYVLLQMLFDTGMRVGELVALTLDEVDFTRMTIRIQHAKFGKWRDIGFGRETHKYLTRYLSLCRPDPILLISTQEHEP
jgi:integrase/recombinase XerD